jgi:hypothetical protein
MTEIIEPRDHILTTTFKNKTIPTAGILLPAIVILIPAIANIGGSLNATTAFAQTDNATTGPNGSTAGTSSGSSAETTASSNASSSSSQMVGVIASIQLDENGNPGWITSGHWTLDSDAPLADTGGGGGASSSNQTTTEPHISNFNATLYMVKNSDGTDFHQHQISNFKQSAVTHQGANSTTVNGTFTITLQQGPVDNVNGYIHIVNDKMELWVDPVASENHFGPTTITGIVLNPERFSELMGHQQ